MELSNLIVNPYIRQDAIDFLENICELHRQVKHKLQSIDEQYKKSGDVHRRKKVF